MTEKLREALHEVAEKSGTIEVPGTLWRDARLARRRQLFAVPVLVLLFVVGIGLGVNLFRDSTIETPPAPAPAGDGRDALPSELHKVPTWIGSPDGSYAGESDLALGTASIAFMTNAGRPVLITADDGGYHLVELPGFEERPFGLMDEATSLALSPDGRHLAWWWHGPLPEPDEEQLPVPSGVRVADLETGTVTTYTMTEDQGVQAGNFAWSANGRYLAYSLLVMDRFNEESRSTSGSWLHAERLDLRTAERFRLPGHFNRTFESTLAVSSRGDVVQSTREGWLTTWIPSRERPTEEFEVEVPDSTNLAAAASSLWIADETAVVIAPTFSTESGRLARVEVADFDRGSVLPSTTLRTLDEPVRLLGQVDDEWVLGFEGNPWDGRLLLYPVAGDVDREPIVVSETVIDDPGEGGELGQLTAAWQLVDPERPSRDFPAPDWPDNPDDRRQQLISGLGALLVVGLGVFVWWRRPRFGTSPS